MRSFVLLLALVLGGCELIVDTSRPGTGDADGDSDDGTVPYVRYEQDL